MAKAKKSENKKLNPFKFYAVKVVERQIEEKILEVPEAKFIFAIIARSHDDSLLVYDEHIKNNGRKFISENNKFFSKYCCMLGLNEEWVCKIFKNEIGRYDDYVAYQHLLLLCFSSVIFKAFSDKGSVFLLLSVMRTVSKKLNLHYFKYNPINTKEFNYG